jgi:hypothetical protein
MENQLPRQVAANPTQYNIDASQTISVGADGSEFPGIHGGRGEGGGTPGEASGSSTCWCSFSFHRSRRSHEEPRRTQHQSRRREEVAAEIWRFKCRLNCLPCTKIVKTVYRRSASC